MSIKDLVKSCIVMYIVVLMLGFVWAEAGAEEYTVFVVDFDFEHAEVILQDEDGFTWLCPFGECNWAIGEEYVLVLEDNAEPQITEL